MYTNDTQLVVLQVVVGKVEPEVEAGLRTRFGKWYHVEQGTIEYPVSCDSHAYDVFNDEFVTSTEARPVEYAGVIGLPYGFDDFEPHTEESSGWLISELDAEGAWVEA